MLDVQWFPQALQNKLFQYLFTTHHQLTKIPTEKNLVISSPLPSTETSVIMRSFKRSHSSSTPLPSYPRCSNFPLSNPYNPTEKIPNKKTHNKMFNNSTHWQYHKILYLQIKNILELFFKFHFLFLVAMSLLHRLKHPSPSQLLPAPFSSVNQFLSINYLQWEPWLMSVHNKNHQCLCSWGWAHAPSSSGQCQLNIKYIL